MAPLEDIAARHGPAAYPRFPLAIDTSDIDVFRSLDVGKGEHQATAVTPAGRKALVQRRPRSAPSRWP